MSTLATLCVLVFMAAMLNLWMISCLTDGAGGGFPAMFVFGDSALDPGNNNNLFTTAKANFPPNGIDFPGGPTGRFCNGLTIADYLANLLGLPIIPAFNNKNTKGANILNGVNYASGGAGILSFASPTLGDKFTMDKQVDNFQKTADELRVELVKIDVDPSRFIAESLIYVSIANNDLFTYQSLPDGLKSALFNNNVDNYIDLMIRTFSEQLKRLYGLGGRRFVVSGVGPIGCIPFQASNHAANGGECWDEPNEYATKYNDKLKPLLTQFKNGLPESNFAYGETYFFGLNILQNSSSYGFKNTKIACCGLEVDGRAKTQCLPLIPLKCSNRSEFLFWDSYHPTAAFNQIAAKLAILPVALSLLS